MSGASLPADPGQWLYDQGVPRFWADAFGEWVRTGTTVWSSLSTAKQESDYCPRMSALYHAYGRRTSPTV